MKTVCFCGMDGSGKTTQCNILTKRLRNLGVEVEVIHLFSASNTVSSNLQGKPLFRMLSQRLRDLPVYGFGGRVKLAIGLISFFVDAWLTYIYHLLKYNRKIVIYDRFFYDQFVIFAATFYKTPWWIINLARILPKGDVTILMEIPPKIGNIRKSEDSVDKLTKCLKFYRLLASILNVEIIDGTRDIGKLAELIYQKCTTLIGKQYETV